MRIEMRNRTRRYLHLGDLFKILCKLVKGNAKVLDIRTDR